MFVFIKLLAGHHFGHHAFMYLAPNNMRHTRRRFIKTTAAGSLGILTTLQGLGHLGNNDVAVNNDLHAISKKLVHEWGATLLKLQVLDKARTNDYGGIWCPTNKLVHGRVGDAMYPFLHLAHTTKDNRYLDGAILLYRWIEQHVSQDDGSWLNEPVKGAWKGTTIFTIIALCDALQYHGALLDNNFKKEMTDRLQKAGEYVYNNFSLDYGNINYPISAAYGLTLLGEMLDIQKYKTKGKEFAHQAIQYITKQNGLLYGEGDILYQASPKGCYAVDLGYNVEESLPNLAMYGLLTKDEEVLQAVTRSLQAHAQFMLPDGGWDNSWGTRNYKWTYWGSRTSDGCQPAYALLADRDPQFYQVALKNTELLQQCTHEGLLYGGPHYVSHGVPPSVHHTFCHIKALATILDHEKVEPKTSPSKLVLPRQEVYGIRTFEEIQTSLISYGGFRATVTGYDKEYKKTKAGHATGGALTMLWHDKTGPLLTASMNEYQLIEAGNMQTDTDPHSICLTPRIELQSGDVRYTNINDLTAAIAFTEDKKTVNINTTSKLVDKDQKNPAQGAINNKISYLLIDNRLECRFAYDNSQATGEKPRVIFPVIAKTGEEVKVINEHTLTITKPKAVVKITSNVKISLLPTTNGRVFNFVPGLEAVPLTMEGQEVRISLEVITKK
jgi:hypothetical protein